MPYDHQPSRREGLRTRQLNPGGLPVSTQIPAAGSLITRMETVLEAVLHQLSRGEEMTFTLLSRRSLRNQDAETRSQRLSFPGRTLHEGQKFARVLLILQLSHDALVSGVILTKRQIFYQHQELFEKQRVVDELVDDLALTFGVNRDALNIVASAKGLVSGPLTIHFNDDTTTSASVGDTGIPIPAIRSIIDVSCRRARWILVVEKDATFRTLASSRYCETSAIGPGLLVTAKGYPDLMTQSFLHYMHEHHAELPILVLTDFDPDGLNIFRCYRFGGDATAPALVTANASMRRLGVNARHIQDLAVADTDDPRPSQQLQRNDGQTPSQETATKNSISSTDCRDPVMMLTLRDRRLASNTLARLSSGSADDQEMDHLRREFQVMLMLGVKAEIQWLDDAGNLTEWLDDNIAQALSLFPVQR